MNRQMNRADFMSFEQKRAIPPGTARTHANMIRLTQATRSVKVEQDDGSYKDEVRIVTPGVARPGKTAKDRALKRNTIA